MKVLVTGSAGLIGSESVRFFCKLGFEVLGIDNNMRQYFFGEEGSTAWNRDALAGAFSTYKHFTTEIRDPEAVNKIFSENDIGLVIHTAAQPSHDWAAREPVTDFTINANGTLTLLEAARRYSPEAVFIFTSTNKVYGDTPNRLPLVELETRYELPEDHPYYRGIDENMSIDQTKHSLFGVSKAAADLMVQEYGRYFGMKTACFRGGCLTGPAHSAAELHGFLSYLMKCAATGKPYKVYGYKGKQVRDNIHSHDLVNAFYHFFRNPREGEVYNLGGGRYSNCSVLEAISLCEEISGRKLNWEYTGDNRAGDHIWWISDNGKFMSHYPDWKPEFDLDSILREIYELNIAHWSDKKS